MRVIYPSSARKKPWIGYHVQLVVLVGCATILFLKSPTFSTSDSSTSPGSKNQEGRPGFRPDATLALPTAEIAVMGPEAAVNAVYYNAIHAIEDPAEREKFVAERRAEYEADVDLLRLASDLVVDAVVPPERLRDELITRLAYASNRHRHFSDRRHGVPPV